MKIYGINSYTQYNMSLRDIKEKRVTRPVINGDSVSFTAKIKAPKTLENEINREIEMLSKSIESVIKKDIKLTPEEILTKSNLHAKKRERKKLIITAKEFAYEFAVKYFEKQGLNKRQKKALSKYVEKKTKTLEKQRQSLEKSEKTPFEPKQKNTTDETIDYPLFYAFQNALKEGDFKLINVLKKHYSKLSDIKTLEELSKTYPKIQIPATPEKNISKAIAKAAGTDFYKELATLDNAGDLKNRNILIENYVKETVKTIAKKNKANETEIYEKISKPATDKINEICEIYINNPEETKKLISALKRNPVITSDDIKLLSTDFNDLILSAFRKFYLEGEDLANYVYEKNGKTIKNQGLKSSGYYINNNSMAKIKRIIDSGEKIELFKRDYKNKSLEELKNRLGHYEDSDLCTADEKIFDTLNIFDSAILTEKDKPVLEKLLTDLDNLHDEKITIKDVVDRISKENPEPESVKNARHLSETAQQRAKEAFKLKQQQNFELNNLKQKFDNAINLLYENKLTDAAEICAKYHPMISAQSAKADAEHIIKIINENCAPGKEINSLKLDSSIKRYEACKQCQTENPELFETAIKFTQNHGDTNPDKVGQYIINSKITEFYAGKIPIEKPASVEEVIINLTKGDKELAIKYLSKYDKYNELPINKKDKITEITKIFDRNNPIENGILKDIIENEYICTDTISKAKINENKAAETIMTANAKQAIFDKYKYPACLDYYKDFENALTVFAPAKGVSGIKDLGTNNNSLRIKELKIIGHPDRIYSTENNYVFDVYDPKGKH